MDNGVFRPAPVAPLDADSAAFLVAPTPRRNIPEKIARAAYAQMSPTQELYGVVMYVFWGVFSLLFGMLLVQSLRAARSTAYFMFVFLLVLLVFMILLGIVIIILGIRNARKVLKKRAHCRWLLKNGTVGEFVVIDVNTIKQRDRAGQTTAVSHVFHLKPVKVRGDKHSYFSQITKGAQFAYARSLFLEKTPTFGLYDPASTDDKRLVLMV